MNLFLIKGHDIIRREFLIPLHLLFAGLATLQSEKPFIFWILESENWAHEKLGMWEKKFTFCRDGKMDDCIVYML